VYTAIKLVGERMKKVILTDIDGVVLDWEEGFSVWMDINLCTLLVIGMV
jgi:hypothetical protein